MAEVPVMAQPLPVVETLLNGNAFALQQRVVPTTKLRGMASMSCYPEAVYLAVGNDKQAASGSEAGVLAKS